MDPVPHPETLTLPEAIRRYRARVPADAFLTVFSLADARARADGIDYIEALKAELTLRLS